MDSYLFIKAVHVVSATILFGTGLGTAFFLYMANRSQNVEAIQVTIKHVVLADWLFTAPAVLIQPVTGMVLMKALGMSYDSTWFYWVAGLYLTAAACWVPVVGIQYRLRSVVEGMTKDMPLPDEWHRLMKLWKMLGYVAFGSVLGIFYLMLIRPGL